MQTVYSSRPPSKLPAARAAASLAQRRTSVHSAKLWRIDRIIDRGWERESRQSQSEKEEMRKEKSCCCWQTSRNQLIAESRKQQQLTKVLSLTSWPNTQTGTLFPAEETVGPKLLIEMNELKREEEGIAGGHLEKKKKKEVRSL